MKEVGFDYSATAQYTTSSKVKLLQRHSSKSMPVPMSLSIQDPSMVLDGEADGNIVGQVFYDVFLVGPQAPDPFQCKLCRSFVA